VPEIQWNTVEGYANGMGGFQTDRWYWHTDVSCVEQGGVFLPTRRLKRGGGDAPGNETLVEAGDGLEKRESRIAGYCVLYCHNGCALVLSHIELPFGGPVFRFHGQGLRDFLDDAQFTCGNGPASVVGMTSRNPDAESDGRSCAFCLVREG